MIVKCKSVAAINKHFNQRIESIERMNTGEVREHLIECADAERVKILQAFDRNASVGYPCVTLRQQGMWVILSN